MNTAPTTIYEEAIRIQLISDSLLQSGILEYLSEEWLIRLSDRVINSDIDLFHTNWLADVIQTCKYFYDLHREEKIGGGWEDLLLRSVERFGERMEDREDDYHDGDSWKYV